MCVESDDKQFEIRSGSDSCLPQYLSDIIISFLMAPGISGTCTAMSYIRNALHSLSV